MAIPHASLAETETLLRLCEDQGWFPRNETQRLRELLDEVSRMLTTVRRGFRGRGKRESGKSEEVVLGASVGGRARIGPRGLRAGRESELGCGESILAFSGLSGKNSRAAEP